MSNSYDKNFQSIDKRFDEVLGAMSQFAESVDRRFDAVDRRFDAIEADILHLKESHDKLINTIDGFVGRIDKYELELAARDHEIERLKRWIHKIAKETGVKLTT